MLSEYVCAFGPVVDASAVDSAGSAAGSTIDEDNDAYIAELNGSSVLSTPRGDSGSGGSGGSGLGGQRDAHGRCEGQHIASAIEASIAEAAAAGINVATSASAATSVATTPRAAEPVSVVNEAGKRLYGGAAQAVLNKRARVEAQHTR